MMLVPSTQPRSRSPCRKACSQAPCRRRRMATAARSGNFIRSLRARCERPNKRRASECGDELSSSDCHLPRPHGATNRRTEKVVTHPPSAWVSCWTAHRPSPVSALPLKRTHSWKPVRLLMTAAIGFGIPVCSQAQTYPASRSRSSCRRPRARRQIPWRALLPRSCRRNGASR